MSSPDPPDNNSSPMSSPSDARYDTALSDTIDTVQDNETWDDLSSPEPELTMMLTELNNRLRSQTQNIRNYRNPQTTESNNSIDDSEIGSLSQRDIPQWQKTAKRTLVFIGYTITTVLFSIIIYLHSLLVRCSYDEETSTMLLDGVFRAQEKAIDDYHRRHRVQVENDDN